jgi:hypothetical protein
MIGKLESRVLGPARAQVEQRAATAQCRSEYSRGNMRSNAGSVVVLHVGLRLGKWVLANRPSSPPVPPGGEGSHA